MAEEKAKEEDGSKDPNEDKEAAGGGEGTKKSKLKIILAIIIIILVIAGGVSLYFFLFTKKATHKKDPDHQEELQHVNKVESNHFFDLAEFVVDLNSQDNKPSFLKLSLTLNLENESHIAEVQSKLPIIRDNFQLYLRELRQSDLNSSGGMYRLKEELTLRINKILAPTQVKDILFREILVR